MLEDLRNRYGSADYNALAPGMRDGYPVRVVIGKKTLDNGQIEVKARKTGNVQMLPADDFVAGIRTVLEELKKSV